MNALKAVLYHTDKKHGREYWELTRDGKLYPYVYSVNTDGSQPYYGARRLETPRLTRRDRYVLVSLPERARLIRAEIDEAIKRSRENT